MSLIRLLAFVQVCSVSVSGLTAPDRGGQPGEVGFLFSTGVELRSNRTVSVSSRLKKQLEYELNPGLSEPPLKNKVVLAIIYTFSLGLCGIDRCYMGQWILGTIKCLTLGGFGFWALIDSLVILANLMQKETSINMLGFYARFSQDEVATAFWIGVVGFILQMCKIVYGHERAKEPRK
eukprot:TRINITY_DN46515_c0_g1_i1.p1 TRINITY_DN46515_c0_g1~~TRINITY_DN46515_c0_g1_i1.p1  ORF type:complete len:178 (+),score=22.65 TRINITY_DN46515_c0_g1_i1:69-602(+)